MGCCCCAKKQGKQKVRRQKTLLVFDFLLLLGGLAAFITSLVGIVLLDATDNANLGSLEFAKFAPLALGLFVFFVAITAIWLPAMEKYRRCRKVLLVILVLCFCLIMICGIILVMVTFYSHQAAMEDSREINKGVGADIRVFTNDYSMMIWNRCCHEAAAKNVLVVPCQNEAPCNEQTIQQCACIVDTELYKTLAFPLEDCERFAQYMIPGPNGTSAPLVGTDTDLGSCGMGEPKQFQRDWDVVLAGIVEPIGITQIIIGVSLLLISGAGLYMMLRRDKLAAQAQKRQKEEERRSKAKHATGSHAEKSNPGSNPSEGQTGMAKA